MSLAFRLFASPLLFLSLTLAAQAQSSRHAACVGKRARVVDGAAALSVGKCDGGDWVAPLVVGQWKHGRRSSATSRARKVLALLQAVGQEQTQPAAFLNTELERQLAKLKPKEPVSVQLDALPPHVREFFGRAETSPPSVVFIVTGGTYYVDQKKYDEFARLVVRIPGANPTIGELLKAVKELSPAAHPGQPEDDLYLRRAWDDEELDTSKTAADYQLANGSILWMANRYR